MSSTSVAPVAVTPSPAQGWGWLKAHERLVMLVLVLAVAGWGYSKHLDSASAKAEARANVAEQALVSQNETNTKNAAQLLSLTQQYQQLTATLAAQNTQLAASLAARQTAQAAQQATDAHLAPSDLAMRLQTLGNAPETSVSVVGNQIELTQPGAIAITQTLETIPVLQADLKDTQADLGATQAAKAQADVIIADQGKQITGLNAAAADQTKACTAQITAVKAEARKSRWHWIERAAEVGLVIGIYVGTHIH